jgi:hypothetical protein
MRTLCGTRKVKVLKYLERTVPQSVPRSSLRALEKLPSNVLSRLHTVSDWDTVTQDAQLKNWLANNAIPLANKKVSSHLFQGTVVIVQVTFEDANKPPSSMSAADVQTVIEYATLAVQPIHRYATRYGVNRVGVWPKILPFTASVKGNSFTQGQFEGWVDECAKIARKDDIENPCIVILHNRELPNSPQFSGNSDPYHAATGNGTPYCYCLVFDENLSVADNNHTVDGEPNEKVYAHILSHEIAEMVVDPHGDWRNPEVCDGCAGDCNVSLFDLFDQNGVFMGGTDDTGSATGFAFFINPIVNANAHLDSNACIVPASDTQKACIYPPPFVTGELLSYVDTGTPGNVSNPILVGFSDWAAFKFVFGGGNAAGQDRIYAVDHSGNLWSYSDAGTQGNVSNPTEVAVGGWSDFKFVFGCRNAAGKDLIYAVDPNGNLWSYSDAGTQGNVSNLNRTEVTNGGWSDFKFVFGGRNAAGENLIYAVDPNGKLRSYSDGTPGNALNPVHVADGKWSDFKFVFAGRNAAGKDRIYAVTPSGELLSYSDTGTNILNSVKVGDDDWLDFEFLFGGTNVAGQDRIYAVAA